MGATAGRWTSARKSIRRRSARRPPPMAPQLFEVALRHRLGRCRRAAPARPDAAAEPIRYRAAGRGVLNAVTTRVRMRAIAGFTLIEVLLATALLAAALALGFATLSAATATVNRSETLARENERMRAVANFLRLRIASARAIGFALDKDTGAPIRFVGSADRMRFVADLPDYLGRGGPTCTTFRSPASGAAGDCRSSSARCRTGLKSMNRRHENPSARRRTGRRAVPLSRARCRGRARRLERPLGPVRPLAVAGVGPRRPGQQRCVAGPGDRAARRQRRRGARRGSLE